MGSSTTALHCFIEMLRGAQLPWVDPLLICLPRWLGLNMSKKIGHCHLDRSSMKGSLLWLFSVAASLGADGLAWVTSKRSPPDGATILPLGLHQGFRQL